MLTLQKWNLKTISIFTIFLSYLTITIKIKRKIANNMYFPCHGNGELNPFLENSSNSVITSANFTNTCDPSYILPQVSNLKWFVQIIKYSCFVNLYILFKLLSFFSSASQIRGWSRNTIICLIQISTKILLKLIKLIHF